MSLTTIDNVKMYLNKESLTALETMQINMLINMVDGQIENYCGWAINAKTYTNKKVDGNGLAEIDLGVYPLNSLTKAEVDDGSGTIVNVLSDVNIKADEGIIYLDSNSATLTTFTSGTQNVTLTYNAGYSTVPNDLMFAATELAALRFKRIVEENIGIVKEKFESDEVEYDKTDIPDAVKYILNNYKRVFYR